MPTISKKDTYYCPKCGKLCDLVRGEFVEFNPRSGNRETRVSFVCPNYSETRILGIFRKGNGHLNHEGVWYLMSDYFENFIISEKVKKNEK